jgi:hypothetical protein
MDMRWVLIPLVAAAAGALAAAEPHLTAVSPVFHQLVAFSLPSEFKSQNATYEHNNGAFYIREHVPEGESVDKWTQMITLTGASNLASNPNATPRGFVSSLANGFRNHCPDTFATIEIGPESIGPHEGFAIVASCGHVQSGAQAFSESAIILAIKGSADMYSVQWARRGAGSSGPMKLDSGYWAKQLARLQPIRLCPIVPGEAAPYPSCVGH